MMSCVSILRVHGVSHYFFLLFTVLFLGDGFLGVFTCVWVVFLAVLPVV